MATSVVSVEPPAAVCSGCGGPARVGCDGQVVCDDCALRVGSRCGICDGEFDAGDWDDRHSGDDGAELHPACCEQFGPCAADEH